PAADHRGGHRPAEGGGGADFRRGDGDPLIPLPPWAERRFGLTAQAGQALLPKRPFSIMNAMSAGVLFGREIERAAVKLAAEAWRLGFGAAPIGNLYESVSDLQARNAVREALRAGIRYFDTAPHYGFGLSESRLGAALAEFDPQGRAVVST